MFTNIKWIVIVLVLLGCTALFIWGDRIQPGSVFAGLAAFIAALKSKLFGIEKYLGKMDLIRRSHELERTKWEREKRNFENRYYIFRAHIHMLDDNIEKLNKELEKTSKPGYRAQGRSEEEILRWLK